MPTMTPGERRSASVLPLESPVGKVSLVVGSGAESVVGVGLGMVGAGAPPTVKGTDSTSDVEDVVGGGLLVSMVVCLVIVMTSSLGTVIVLPTSEVVMLSVLCQNPRHVAEDGFSAD
jgi:hypothetical protein